MLFLFLFLSTDFTDFTEGWEGGINHGFTRIFTDFPTSDLNFLTSDFTDLTDVGYALMRGRDEGARMLYQGHQRFNKNGH